MYNLEKELFPPIKKYLHDLGLIVYVEVPNNYRSIDVVGVSSMGEQSAIELKLHFNASVVRQAYKNRRHFHRSYVAVPTKDIHVLTKLYGFCVEDGIGILQILPDGKVNKVLESKFQIPTLIYDFSGFEDREEDEAGVPYQKGTSEAFVVLDRVKRYVRQNPRAEWKEIYRNVQNHYTSPKSLAGSMKQWKGFSLYHYKETLRNGGEQHE